MTFISNDKWMQLKISLANNGIDEKKIQESFILGSGSGGQKVNKTHSTVQIKYQSHNITYGKSRHRDKNRYFARKILLEKVLEGKGIETKKTQIKARKIKQKKRRKKKSSIKYKDTIDK